MELERKVRTLTIVVKKLLSWVDYLMARAIPTEEKEYYDQEIEQLKEMVKEIGGKGFGGAVYEEEV